MRISVWVSPEFLDDKPFIRWQGPQADLSVPDDVILVAPKCAGLGAHLSPVMFRSARLRMLTGKARVLR
ncbi:MAG: hypothetical protein IMZ65_04210 [Planctomycetes bacterium]|nr:hypothetical protein [Planctomycetota bacterium]